MATDYIGLKYKCGCKYSLGAWYLCPKHDNMIIADVEVVKNETEPTD